VVAVAKSRPVPECFCVVGSKCYYTVVVEDLSASKFVATATLLVEVLAVAPRMPCHVHVKNARHCQLCSYLSCALSSCSRSSSDAEGMCPGACWQYKFLRGGHLCGHIEDVVVDASQRYGCRLDVCECADLFIFGRGVIVVLDTLESHAFETPLSPMHSCMQGRKNTWCSRHLGGMNRCIGPAVRVHLTRLCHLERRIGK